MTMESSNKNFSLSADLIYPNDTKINNPIQQSTTPSCSIFKLPDKEQQEQLFMNKFENDNKDDVSDIDGSPRIILPKTCCQTFKNGFIHNIMEISKFFGLKR
jgi:hypothetical protein